MNEITIVGYTMEEIDAIIDTVNPDTEISREVVDLLHYLNIDFNFNDGAGRIRKMIKNEAVRLSTRNKWS